jgi:hypothetical protein
MHQSRWPDPVRLYPAQAPSGSETRAQHPSGLKISHRYYEGIRLRPKSEEELI